MFGSRKKGRKHYTPPTASSVNPSAATAAVSAYNLSSAAAAAALRNLPAAPTNVGAVQTKRTMRRSASVSSEGSRRALSPVPSIKRAMGLGGNKDTREGVVVSPTGAPTLRRRGSSSSIRSMSSMTERTFRSPSPHGSRTAALSAAASASPGGSVASNQSLSMNAAGTAAAMAAGRSTGAGSRSRSVPPPPPVPIIPKHHIDNQAKQPQPQQQQTEKQARRATTLGLVQQPLQLASQKQKSGRSSWFGSAAVGKRADIRNSDAAMDINGYAQPERPGSRNSLQNFSYPSRQRVGSPPPSPTNTRSAAATAAVSAAAASPAAAKLPRSASTERVTTKQPQQRVAAASARRSASTSRVTGRSNAGLSDQTLVYDANSRRMVPRGELLMLEQSILDAAERPQQQQRKKKQQRGTAAASLTGSHLSQGTMTHAHGTAAPLNRAELERLKEPAPQQAAAVTVPAPKTPKSPPPERQLPKIATTALEEPAAAPVEEQPAVVEKDLEDAQPVPALSTSASTPSSSVSSLTALAASQATTSPVAIQSMSSPEDGSFDGTLLTEDGRPVLVKRPSIVREEPDREEEEEKQHQAGAQKPQLSDAAAVVAAANGSRAARDDLDGVSAKHIQHDSQPKAQPPAQQAPAQAQPPVVKPSERERTRSNSPVRTAHFSPVVSSNLTVRRHSPPPRSISPRKSAMKHSSSPRDASPSDSASEANHSLQGDLAPQNRKKANRVSFDDKAVVVSQSPMPPSPPHSPGLSSLPGASEAPANSNAAHQPPSRSRSWFSNIGRSKKKGSNSLDDDDVVMKPRPALPSFGSVRDKNPHQAQHQEERALVRPIVNDSQPPRQTTRSPPPASGPTTAPAAGAPLEKHSTSSDHAIGFIIGADRQAQTASPSAQRNTANTSRYREPLPPVVTSVDGSGYVSDSGASSDGDDEDVLDVSDEEKEHSPILRFDEEQDTTVPAKLEDEPIIPTVATAEEAEPLIILPSASSPKSPKKAVPAIAITNPSQENLTAVRGTENDEDEDEEENIEKAEATTEDATTERSVKRNSLGAHVPGMFPADTDSDGTAKSASPTKATFAGVDPNAPVPTRGNTFEPITQDDDNSYSPQMPATVFATHMPTLHEETSLRNEKMTEDDSDSEVFSDAYEDLSDIEGDGFLSLDAVVDSPIAPEMVKSPFAPSSLPGSPSRKTEVLQLGPSALAKEMLSETEGAEKSTAMLTSAAAAGGAVIGMTALTSSAIHKQVNGGDSASNGPEDEEDWEKVKAFWRGLTVEKRAQLEKEALQDAADEGDLEDESSAAKKPRRKKSVETRIAEKKAIQELAPAKAVAAPVATTKPAVAKAPAASAPPAEKQSQKSAATRMRRSMRDDAPRAGASNVDDNDYVASLRPNPPAQKERVATGFPPKAAVGAVSRPNVLHSRTMSADSTGSVTKSGGMAGLLPSALRRRGSDSSESSFKRARSNSNGAATGGAAAGAANFRMSMRGSGGNASDFNHRSSRFSLRSLSPTGSATLRGSTESSPQQFRRSMRDGSGSGFGATPIDMKRMSSPGPMANSTLRKGPSDSGGGFFSSLGKKRGSKLLQRAKNEGGGMGFGGKSSRSRFGDSSDDDDDVFGTARPSTGGGGGLAANRRSMSVGGAYTFRSRFVDSSDEDEVVPDHRILGGSKVNKDKDHVVPKTLRTGSSMRSASARPASSHTPLSPLLPEELEEEEEEKKTRSNTARNSLPATMSASAANLGINNNNLGTSTLRRSRSGRGQIAPVSPMYSPTTTGAVGLNTGSNVTPTRRSGGIMSVLRRKKTDPISPVSGYTNKIQRAALVDSAARRDTQLERSTAELAAVRSNSIGSQNRRTLNGASGSGGSTPRFVPQNDDSDDDLDDSEDSPVAARRAATGLAGNTGRSPAAAVRMDSWPLPGPNDNNSSIGTAGGGSKGKKKFPSLRRMFRLDD